MTDEVFQIEGYSVFLYEDDIPEDVLKALEVCDTLSVDTEYKTAEMNNFYVPTTKLALIQIFSKSVGVVVVRVHRGGIPKNIVKLLSNESIHFIFHHAFMDCSLLYHHWRVLPKNVICTKVAAKLWLMDKEQSSSLRELLKNILHLEISKIERTSDWLTDTLTHEQIHYAARDTMYLETLNEELKARLLEKGEEWLNAARLNWAAIPAQVFNNTKGVTPIYGELYNY